MIYGHAPGEEFGGGGGIPSPGWWPPSGPGTPDPRDGGYHGPGAGEPRRPDVCTAAPLSTACACQRTPGGASCKCANGAASGNTDFSVCKVAACGGGRNACQCCDNTRENVDQRAYRFIDTCATTMRRLAKHECQAGREPRGCACEHSEMFICAGNTGGLSRGPYDCVSHGGSLRRIHETDCTLCMDCFMDGARGTSVTVGGNVSVQLDAVFGSVGLGGSAGSTRSWPAFSGYTAMCRETAAATLRDAAMSYVTCEAEARCPGTQSLPGDAGAGGAPAPVEGATGALVRALSSATIRWRGSTAVVQ